MNKEQLKRVKALRRKHDAGTISLAEKAELSSLTGDTWKAGKVFKTPSDAEIAKHTPYGEQQALGVIRAGSAKSGGTVTASQTSSRVPTDAETRGCTPINESSILGYIRAASAIRRGNS